MPSERGSSEQRKGETISLSAGPAEARPRPRLQRVNREQMILRAIEVEKLIAADHPARAIWELVGRLELSGFTAQMGRVAQSCS